MEHLAVASQVSVAGLKSSAVMASASDVFNDSFYLHLVRQSIGSALKEKFAVKTEPPDRTAELLRELDEAEGAAAVTTSDDQQR